MAHRTSNRPFRRALIVWAVASGAVVLAQPIGLPSDTYDGFRRVQGDRVAFCTDTSLTTSSLERSIMQAIADRLLLDVRFVDVRAEYSISADSILEDMFVWLADHCDAYGGINYAPGGHADWMSMTRPYVRYRTVLATNDLDATTLLELPRDGTIGALMASPADLSLIAYLQSLPASERWRRLPYGDNAVMLERLRDGTLAAALVWEPALEGHLGPDGLEAAGLRTIGAQPLFGLEMDVAFALLVHNVFLRHAIDSAIGALLSDGTLASIVAEASVPALTPTVD